MLKVPGVSGNPFSINIPIPVIEKSPVIGFMPDFTGPSIVNVIGVPVLEVTSNNSTLSASLNVKPVNVTSVAPVNDPVLSGRTVNVPAENVIWVGFEAVGVKTSFPARSNVPVIVSARAMGATAKAAAIAIKLMEIFFISSFLMESPFEASWLALPQARADKSKSVQRFAFSLLQAACVGQLLQGIVL